MSRTSAPRGAERGPRTSWAVQVRDDAGRWRDVAHGQRLSAAHRQWQGLVNDCQPARLLLNGHPVRMADEDDTLDLAGELD